MLRTFIEKRRKRPSYVIPIVFFCLELVLIWLVISLFNWSIDITKWHIASYFVTAVWLIFISIKLSIVLKRQKIHYD